MRPWSGGRPRAGEPLLGLLGGPVDIGCWMLDTDHDGESFVAKRTHFPGADKDAQPKNPLSRLRRRVNEAETEAPRPYGQRRLTRSRWRKIAVEVITCTETERQAWGT